MQDIPTNTDGECSLVPITAFDDGHFAAEEGAGTIVDLVGVAMVTTGVAVAVPAFMRVGMFCHGGQQFTICGLVKMG
jgi:hypothetical protein